MNGAASLQKRAFRLDDRGVLCGRGPWFAGRPLATQFLNAYSLLIPEGERFVIRACRDHADRAGAGLRAELACLFFQEAGHSREHARMVRAMQAEKLALDPFRRAVSWLSYQVLEPLFPPGVRLATAAAIEHHNAAIAAHFLGQDLLRGIREGELRRLFLWHFAEEIEHKEVVFRLLEQVSRSWALRALGLAASCGTFLLYLAIGTILLAMRTGAVQGMPGLLAVLARESLRYLRPGFRPRLEESRDLLAVALAELERLGVERPKSGARALPAAFREKMAPSLERVRGLRAFFGARIGGHDGAWVRSEGTRKLNFCTYSYLGLLGHPRIQHAARQALDRYGTGTHGVRLLGGNLEIHCALEERIASFFGREAAITFSSGFMTNQAAIAALVGRGDHVLCDTLNHASIVDGCRASGAAVSWFRHNDMRHLACKLAALPVDARKLIVVDAVYSMDGDLAPLPALIDLRDRHPNTLLMVDEAHSLGVLGARGRGVEEHFGCHGQIDVLMGTLSKTIPAQGGYIAGSQDLIDYLRINARGFVFSAALPPATAAAALAAFDLVEREGAVRRARLMANVEYFAGRLRMEGFDLGTGGASAIIPVLLGEEALAVEIAKRCKEAGIFAMPVAWPAVARGCERLRLNVTSEHRRADLDFAVCVMVKACKR